MANIHRETTVYAKPARHILVQGAHKTYILSLYLLTKHDLPGHSCRHTDAHELQAQLQARLSNISYCSASCESTKLNGSVVISVPVCSVHYVYSFLPLK